MCVAEMWADLIDNKAHAQRAHAQIASFKANNTVHERCYICLKKMYHRDRIVRVSKYTATGTAVIYIVDRCMYISSFSKLYNSINHFGSSIGKGAG